jgi:hypothetical protein
MFFTLTWFEGTCKYFSHFCVIINTNICIRDYIHDERAVLGKGWSNGRYCSLLFSSKVLSWVIVTYTMKVKEKEGIMGEKLWYDGWRSRMGKGRFTLSITVPFRSITNSSEWSCVHSNGDERNYDVTVTFMLMWTSPFDYAWYITAERWRSVTERKVTNSGSLFNGTAEQWTAHESCAFLGCQAAHGGNSLPTFRDNILVLTLENVTDTFSPNVLKELLPYAA